MNSGMCVVCGYIGPRGDRVLDDLGCAECRDQMHAPFNLDEQVTITLSGDELTVLTTWAYRRAETLDATPKITSSSVKVVSLILERLALQTNAALFPSQFYADLEVEHPSPAA